MSPDRRSAPARSRHLRLLTWIAAFTAFCWLSVALAQPTPAPGHAPKALPPGHPALGQPAPTGQPPARHARPAPDQIRRLQELARRRGLGRRARPKPSPAPATEHLQQAHAAGGECLGHGPNDRPGEINLLHGWLGVDNEAAAVEPRRQSSFDWEWWKWRLTPYPWRYQNKQDHCDPRNEPVPLIANVLNLAILLFLVVRFGRKPLAEALSRRRKTIMGEIERAADLELAAKQRLARYRDDLAHLDERLTALRDKYRSQGELDEQRIEDDARRARQRLLAGAELRVAQESKAAYEALSRGTLEEALRNAEHLLSRNVSEADHERLAEEYLDQVAAALRGGARPQGGNA